MGSEPAIRRVRVAGRKEKGTKEKGTYYFFKKQYVPFAHRPLVRAAWRLPPFERLHQGLARKPSYLDPR